MLDFKHILSTLLLLSLPFILGANSPSWGAATAKTQNIGPEDIIPNVGSSEAYSETYSFAINFGSGGHIGVDFRISNLGWGDGSGNVQVRVRHPDHQNYSYSKTFDRGDWSFSKKHFAIKMGKTSVEYDDSAFVIEHNRGPSSFKIDFKQNSSIWSPGNGKLAKGESYYKFHLLALMADVTGTLNLRGTTHQIDEPGKGYAEHAATNVAPYDFGKRWSRFRTRSDGLSIIWREIKLTEAFGGASRTWIVVGYKGDIVFSSSNAEIKLSDIKKDPSTGYSFPMAIQINASDGSETVKFAMHGKSFKRKNLLESYGVAAKFVASTLTEPYRYTVKCKHSLKLQVDGYQATMNGDSHYTLDYTNK